MQVKEQQLEPDMEQWTGSNLGKEYIKAVYCHPAYLTYMQSLSWEARLHEAQAGIKIARRYINNLRYVDDTTLMAESKELKSFLMKVEEKSEKAGLKLNIQKTSSTLKKLQYCKVISLQLIKIIGGGGTTKIVASVPITSWQIEEGTKETVTDFIFLDSKITVDGDFSHEIKRCFLLGRKAMTNLDSILKSRDILCEQRSI